MTENIQQRTWLLSTDNPLATFQTHLALPSSPCNAAARAVFLGNAVVPMEASSVTREQPFILVRVSAPYNVHSTGPSC